MAQKQNCWEFKNCGKEPGGGVDQLGVCPAASDIFYNGLNGGKNAGRICWVAAGTLCGGKVQGVFAEKRLTCETCDFYEMVKEEEKDQFIPL